MLMVSTRLGAAHSSTHPWMGSRLGYGSGLEQETTRVAACPDMPGNRGTNQGALVEHLTRETRDARDFIWPVSAKRT